MRHTTLSLFTVLLFGAFASGCASNPPPPAAPTITYEQKVAWILRLEDQRVLRDAAPAPAPVPVAPGKKKNAAATPPAAPTPDLLKLVTDSDARLRRRAALAIGRVG